MLAITISYILLTVLFGSVNSQIFTVGNCDPDTKVKENFDKSKYTGIWYEYNRSVNVAEEDSKCHMIDVILSEDLRYDILSYFIYKTGDNNCITMPFSAEIIEDEAKLNITPGFISDKQELLVIDTDYEHFAIVYSCMNLGRGKLEFVWIMTRKPYPNMETIIHTEDVLKDRGFAKFPFITDIHDCITNRI